MPWEIKLIRVVVGILKRQEKILVCKRPDSKPYAGYWEFPGGKIEEEELPVHALYREIHEELGINVENAVHLFNHEHTYPDKSVHLELFLIDVFSGEPHGKEGQEIRWIAFDEIYQLNLLEGNWQLLETLRGFLGK